MTSVEHNKYLALAFLVYGVIQTLLLLVVSLFFLFIIAAIPVQENPEFPPQILFGVIFGFAIIVQLALAMPLYIASYGIWKRKSWAKIAGMIGGVVASLNFPLGTALCVYVFWFFLGDVGKEIYGRPKDVMLSGGFNVRNMEEYAPPPQTPSLWE